MRGANYRAITRAIRGTPLRVRDRPKGEEEEGRIGGRVREQRGAEGRESRCAIV